MHTAPTLPGVEGVSHRWVLAHGLFVHCAEYGPLDGRPVVLLHGWPQHWYVWRHVLPLLPDDVRVLMPDLRGLGWTAAPRGGYGKEQLALDVAEVLDVLGVGPALVVGHDWGGWIGHLLALRRPERVRALLSLAILPPVPDLRIGPADRRRFAYQPALAAPVVPSLVLRALPGVVERVLVAGAASSFAWEREALQSYAAVLRDRERARASSRYYRSLLLEDLAKVRAGRYAAPLSMPSTLLLGAEDPVIRPRFLPPGHPSETRVLPGVGHFVPEEAPAAVAEQIVAALARPA